MANAQEQGELSPEEQAALDEAAPVTAQPTGDEEEPIDEAAPRVDIREKMADLESSTGVPSWAKVPADLKFPSGRQVGFLQFRSKWTDRPDKPDRQCIVWNLSAQDEKLALKRSRGDDNRTLDEMAKAMIRAIDGEPADWSGNPEKRDANPDTFYNEIGSKCRGMLKNYYLRTHTMTTEEKIDFFANCIAVTSSAG